MSINYAEALSPYQNKGKLGQKEIFDSGAELNQKIDQLANEINISKFTVVLTGAGISTSAGIPDFRGPKGVWTLEKKNETPQSADFLSAKPTFTHYALVALEKAGKIKHLISQNVDNLHIRSGFPVDRLVEVHGNCFVDQCNRCQKYYFRKQPSKTVGCKQTGDRCTEARCRGFIHDTVLDWEDFIPKPFYSVTEPYTRAADLFIVLGSSLQIKPVGDLPLLAKKSKQARVVYINLQKINRQCFDIAIHAPVDDVFEKVMKQLSIPVEKRESEDPVLFSIFPPSEDGISTLNKMQRKRKMKKLSPNEEKVITSNLNGDVKKNEEADEANKETCTLPSDFTISASIKAEIKNDPNYNLNDVPGGNPITNTQNLSISNNNVNGNFTEPFCKNMCMR